MPSPPRHRSRVRTRIDDGITLDSFSYEWNGWEYVKTPTGSRQLQIETDFEVCDDYNNRHNADFHRSDKVKSGYTGGYPFDLYRSFEENPVTPLPEELSFYPGSLETFSGGICISAQSQLEERALSAGPDGDSFKATEVAMEYSYLIRARRDLRPDLPSFDLMREVAELRDIPGLIKETRASLLHMFSGAFGLRRGAKAYLGIQFGYLPLVSSIRSFLATYRSINKRLQQLIRDDGKQVRRRREYVNPKKSAKSWSVHYSGWEAMPPVEGVYFDPDSCHVDITVKTADRVWCVGSYQYRLPEGVKDLKWAKKVSARIFNMRLTLGQVYDLIPWTWLIDWFSNVGSYVHSFDPGVADQGAFTDFYGMSTRQTVLQYKYTCLGYPPTGGPPIPITLYASKTIWRKSRLVLGPFEGNFWSEAKTSMSQFQLSILGALGVAKFPRVFRPG